MAARRPDGLLDRLRSLSGAQLDTLREFAERNRVAPIVAHSVLDAFPDQSSLSLEPWADIHASSAQRMHVLMEQLDLVARRLAECGIRMIALKNAGIARAIYPCAACCPMGDLDVLIDRDHFHEAHAAVLQAGYQLASRSSIEPADVEHGLISGGTEYVKHVDGEEVWLELQWRAVAGRWVRRDQEPPTRALLAASRDVAGSAVRVLSAVDNMLQVCLHTAKHTYVRAPGLRLHTDVDRLTTYDPPDWETLVERTNAMHVRTPVFFSLALARALLGTPVPLDVLEKLQPSSIKRQTVVRWLRAVDVFEPDERKFNRLGMVGFHALMYDTPKGLLASVLDTDESQLGPRHLSRNLRRGSVRVRDLLTRYER
jgi:hypothetical protein